VATAVVYHFAGSGLDREAVVRLLESVNMQQQEDTSMAVLDLVVCHINSVHTLARLSAVNKRCRDLCALQATHQLQMLLLPALRKAAAVPKSPLYEQHIQDIRWLCSVADREAVAAASAAVLAVPNVPASAAHCLAEAGVRVSDAAVMAAALKQQLGAEIWLVKMDCVFGRTGMPLARLSELLRIGTGALHGQPSSSSASKDVRNICKHNGAVLPLSSAPEGRGADGVDAMA
jgi:hypothetical protein